jgi:hypothetical protein
MSFKSDEHEAAFFVFFCLLARKARVLYCINSRNESVSLPPQNASLNNISDVQTMLLLHMP